MVAALLVVATFAVYGQVLGHEFVDYDDLQVIVWNENLRPASPADALARAFATTLNANWIPLTTLSLQLDRALWGARPGPTLLANAALHAAAAVALFLALARLSGAVGRSAFAAGVFALHPLHVESVAWASERKDPLAALCFALGLFAYARYAERPGLRRGLAVCAWQAAGLLAKPVLVTFPCVLLLLDFWPLRRLATREARRRAVLEKLPLAALSAAASLVTLLVQERSGAMQQAARIPFLLRAANAADAIGAYLVDAFWPAGLAVFYPHPLDALPTGRALAWAAAIALLCGLTVRRRRRAPWLATGLFWFLGMLVPMLGLVQVGMQARADRYTYLPLVGLAIALAWQAEHRLGRSARGRRALAAAALAALLGLAGASALQVRHWRDAVALHERAVGVTQGNFMEHQRLARALLERGRAVEAEYHFARSAEIEPRRADPLVGLGDARLRQGRVEDAVQSYRRALAVDPAQREAPSHLAIALVRAGRPAEALATLGELSSRPGDDPALQLALARAQASLGDPRSAIERYREALRLRPESSAAATELAWILATSPEPELRDPAEALRLAESALRTGPPSALALDALAAACAASGRFDAAAEQAQRALALATRANPPLAAALRERLALYRAGRPYLAGGVDRLR